MFFKQAKALVLGTILGITGISFVDIKQAISQPAPPLSSVAITAVQRFRKHGYLQMGCS